MFEEFNIKQLGKIQVPINIAKISKIGIFVVVDQRSNIQAFHHSRSTSRLDLRKQLINHQLTYSKCYGINEVLSQTNSTQSVFILLLDDTVCLVSVQLISENLIQGQQQQQLRINLISKFCLNVQNINSKCKLRIMTCQFDRVILSLHKRKEDIKIFTVAITTQYQLVLKQQNTLRYNRDELLSKSLFLRLQSSAIHLKIFKKFIILYTEKTFSNEWSHYFMAWNLDQQGEKVIYPIIDDLLDRCMDYERVLREIYISQFYNDNIKEANLMLFYQGPNPQIVVIHTKNLSTPIKKKTLSNFTYISMIKSSINASSLELRGEQYCILNESLLIHIKDAIYSDDKLMLIASPQTNKQKPILNEIILPKNLIQIEHVYDSIFLICKHQIFELQLASKIKLYYELLKFHKNIQALPDVIQQLLK